MDGRISIPLVPLRSAAASDGPLISELLYGEEIKVIGRQDDWLMVENCFDRHTGYIPANAISRPQAATHYISVPGSFLYPGASMKLPDLGRLSFFSKVTVLDIDGKYARTPDGFVHVSTIKPVGELFTDPVDVARLFLNVPYKWGGRSSTGLDCSSLTQFAFAACGVTLPKNAGPQRKVLAVDTMLDALERNDLIFTPGHVMLYSGDGMVIHADGMAGMWVREMPLEQALKDRGVLPQDAICKKSPIVNPLNGLRRDNAINYNAFLGLSGPDIMS